MLTFNVDDVAEPPEGKSCLDCCNFSEDGPDGYCRLAEDPRVIHFCNDSDAWEDGNMSCCPGFVEDI